MDEEPSTSGPAVSSGGDPEQIRDEIESTREELGDTVEALAAKTDVKAQARQKLDDTKEQVSAKKDEFVGKARDVSPDSARVAASGAQQKAKENPVPLAAIAAFAVGFLAGRVSAR